MDNAPRIPPTSPGSSLTAATAHNSRLQKELDKAHQGWGYWENRSKDLERKFAQCKESVGRLNVELEEEKALAATRRLDYDRELDQQKAKFDELNSLHIRSVNLVATGLEPISDQEFKTSIRGLQDQVPSPSAACDLCVCLLY